MGTSERGRDGTTEEWGRRRPGAVSAELERLGVARQRQDEETSWPRGAFACSANGPTFVSLSPPDAAASAMEKMPVISPGDLPSERVSARATAKA